MEKKFYNEDWKKRLEAIKLNINVPLDVECDTNLRHKKDDTNLRQNEPTLKDLGMEEQNGIL